MTEEEYEVEEIFGHKMDKGKRLKLHIKWVNYSYSDSTWEPYENMSED